MLNPKTIVPVLMINFLMQPLNCQAANDKKEPQPSGDLVTTKHIKIQPGLVYSKLSWKGSTVHCISFDTKSDSLRITPYINENVKEPSLTVKDADAVIAVNGGFFNLSDGESTSYVTIDGKSMCEPKENKALIENPKLKAFLLQIFDRSEIRFQRSAQNVPVIEIVKHSTPITKGLTLEAALQGGPQILPQVTSATEAFIRKDETGKSQDSIGTKRKAARTAIGITDDGKVKILCAEGGKKNEFVEGMSLDDLASVFQRLGCKSALNLDGGTSTAMVVNLEKIHNVKDREYFSSDAKAGVIYSAAQERRVKTLLCIVEKQKK